MPDIGRASPALDSQSSLPSRSPSMSSHISSGCFSGTTNLSFNGTTPSGKFRVMKCPSDALALYNCVIGSPNDFSTGDHILVHPEHTLEGYAMTIRVDPHMEPGNLGFTFHQRKWAELALNKEVLVSMFEPTQSSYPYISKVKLEVSLLSKKAKAPSEPLVSHEMAGAFIEMFQNMVLSVGQTLVLDYRSTNLLVVVKDLEIITLHKLQLLATRGDTTEDVPSDIGGVKVGQYYHVLTNGHCSIGTVGVLMSQSTAIFDKAEGSPLNIVGTAKGSQRTMLINPDWNFEQMGIGGLDKEFSAIFRRAFASRVFPPDLVARFGIPHVRGILLYGPPGTGKTLMARQIGKMLNAVEPKIVNGPEILNKYVGASEENIRNLFKDAEAEQAAKGDYSQLHIIIFDEIDAIMKQRGSKGDSTGVQDTVVNQLLSKMDGVDQLNNILVIGMTNRKDLIDEAMLRPGRLEVQMEINLPDEHGRVQILNIHTLAMKENHLLDDSVNILELAEQTKNFSGAELAGLVRSASSFAFNRKINAENLGQADYTEQTLKDIKITQDDFIYALDENKPAFGVAEDEFAHCLNNGIMKWGPVVQQILDDGKLIVEQVRNSARTPLVSVLFEGMSGAGKTALAATVAMKANFPFVKLITPENFVGMGEAAKCSAITKVFDDAYKSTNSIIVVDNVERLLDYVPIGPRFSNQVLQTLMVLMKKMPKHGRRLLVLCTTSTKGVLSDMGMLESFNAVVKCPCLTTAEQVKIVLEEIDLFDDEDLNEVIKSLEDDPPMRMMIAVKTLLMIAEMARQDEANKVSKFLMNFRNECDN